MRDVRTFRWLRRLSVVPRWSVMPTIRKQNVAEHSFHVASLSMWLVGLHARGYNGKFELEVLRYALTHDVKEAIDGDMPSPSKKTEPVDASDQVKVVVKTADVLEAMLFMYEEQLMGNRMGVDDIIDYLYKRTEPWWDAFEKSEKYQGLSLAHLIESARFIAYNSSFSHPSIEEEEPCTPIR